MKPRRVMVDFEAIWEAMDEKRKESPPASPPNPARRTNYMTWAEVAEVLETQDWQLAGMKWKKTGISPHTLLAILKWLDRDLREFEK